MTRHEILLRLLKKGGTPVCVGGKDGYAVVCPFGVRRSDVPTQYLYLSEEALRPSVGNSLEVGGTVYLVTRSDRAPLGDGNYYACARLQREDDCALCMVE